MADITYCTTKNNQSLCEKKDSMFLELRNPSAMPFSFSLFKTPSPVLGFAQQGDIIIENDGLFSISCNIETTGIPLDTTFKQLVDSILI